MKQLTRNLSLLGLAIGTLFAGVVQVNSQTQLSVDPAAGWIGYMNVFELNNTYLWGSGWAPADLPATFSGAGLTLSPNVNVYNASDPYWVNPDGSGAKLMEANFYVENLSLVGQNVTFSGSVLANSLAPGYNSQAFIKVLDPALGYATVQQIYAPLVGGQNFSLNLLIGSTAGLIPQYGFMTRGPDANPATVGALGSVLIQVPEPSSFALAVLGMLGLGASRRLRRG